MSTPTVRQAISDVRSMHKLLSGDGIINDRTIASSLKDNAGLLIKRETNLRKLWSTDSIFTTIPCLEMVEVPLSECCDYQDPVTIARSKHKIPRMGEGVYQYIIQGVYSINILGGRGQKLKEITANRYVNLLKLDVRQPETYYIISDDYLYVTNSDVEKVRLVAYFESDIPSSILYPQDCACSQNVPLEELCINPLDKTFKCPGYLLQQVKQMTSQDLLGKYFRVPEDKTSDNKDDTSPNKN